MLYIAIGFMIVGGLLIALNWSMPIASIVTKKFHSMVPPLGGLILAIGLAINPTTRPYAVFGLLLDCGFWALLFAIPFVLRDMYKSAPWRRVRRVSGHLANTSVDLNLYRPNYYTIKLSRSFAVAGTGWTGLVSYGNWRKTDDGMELTSFRKVDEEPAKCVLRGDPEIGGLVVVESSAPSDRSANDLPPTGMKLS